MQNVFTKITIRIMPFLVLLYLVAFLDRVNIGFAALAMNHDLGISERMYGFAAGMFFIGYFLCEVPSNLLLTHFGARFWIARIMVTWGILSTAMAFAGGGVSYTILRTVLGAAEAGFFPGIVLYLTFWLPRERRASLMSLFVFAIPLANVVGSPISTSILRLHLGGGFRPWQWLFILEGIPAIVLGCLVPWVLTNDPGEAKWLTREEKLIAALSMSADEPAAEQLPKRSWAALLTRAFWGYVICYFALMSGLYGLGLFLPQILQARNVPLSSIGTFAAISHGSGGLLALAWAYHSDLQHEKRWHIAVSYISAAVGLFCVAASHSSSAAILGFALSAFGIYSGMPIFWSSLTDRVSGTAAAAGIAIVNSLGNLGGFIGPSWMGWMAYRTGNNAAGLFGIAIVLALAGGLCTFLISSNKTLQGEVGHGASLRNA
jgi:ACS family tartrate transporter-like MFS transporter